MVPEIKICLYKFQLLNSAEFEQKHCMTINTSWKQMLVTQSWRQFLDVGENIGDNRGQSRHQHLGVVSHYLWLTFFVSNICHQHRFDQYEVFSTFYSLYLLIISQIKKSKNGIDFVTCVSTICAVFGTGTGYVFFQWNFSRLLIPTRTRPEFGLFGVK